MKKTVLLVMLLCTALLLTACGNDTSGQKADVSCAEVVEAVIAGQTFEEMTALDERLILSYLDLDEALVADMAMSMDASRATPEAVIVIKAVDKDALTQVQEALQFYRDSTLEQYRDYRPAELPKLEDAKVATSGLMAALVISGDATQAEKSLADAWK